MTEIYRVKKQELTPADVFYFQLEGEEEILGIPKLDMLPFEIQENLARADKLDGKAQSKAMAAIFLGVLDAIYEDEDLAAKIKSLSSREVSQLMSAWGRSSRVSLGKSQPSRASSKKKKRR